MKKIRILYIALCTGLCLLPFAGMAVARTDTTTENRKLAGLPAFTQEDGSFNKNYLPELGAYFLDHYAFRQEMVTADAKLNASLFGESTADNVLVGKDGWLYYAATLDDYLGKKVLSDKEITHLANNLRQIQNYVESRGSRFTFTIAPNKNTLYGENMPDYEQEKVSRKRNADRLEGAMDAAGVNYVNLFKLFEDQDEVLYYKRDSHWNNKGAVMVYDALLDQQEIPHEDYSGVTPEMTDSYVGDLNAMLYPADPVPETYADYGADYSYRYLVRGEEMPSSEAEEKIVEEAIIETIGGKGDKSLLMYRDSFGNSLLPFMADAYDRAIFRKTVPYNIETAMDQMADPALEKSGPDSVMIELVERNLNQLVQYDETDVTKPGPPVIWGMSPDADMLKIIQSQDQSQTDTQSQSAVAAEGEGGIAGKDGSDPAAAIGSILVKRNESYNDYWTITGDLSFEEAIPEKARLFVKLTALDGDETDQERALQETAIYEAYTISSSTSEDAFLLYLKDEAVRADKMKLEVVMVTGKTATTIGECEIGDLDL